MKKIISTIFFLAVTCLNPAHAEEILRKEITKKIENEVFIYAAMASNAYKDRENFFDLHRIGWEKLALNGSVISSYEEHTYERGRGLAFDAWRRIGTNDVVLSFRGSDSKYDYIGANIAIFSIQYKSAKKQVKKFLARNPNLRLYATTGHSLGGGLALSISLKYHVPSYAFDSSPRIFDGFMDRDLHDEEKNQIKIRRINVFQSGEILSNFRSISTKFYDVVREEYFAEYPFGHSKDGNEISPHSGYHLALMIVRNASKSSPEAALIIK